MVSLFFLISALFTNEDNSIRDIFLASNSDTEWKDKEDLKCTFQVVESIPEGLVYNDSAEWTSLQTFEASHISITTYY